MQVPLKKGELMTDLSIEALEAMVSRIMARNNELVARIDALEVEQRASLEALNLSLAGQVEACLADVGSLSEKVARLLSGRGELEIRRVIQDLSDFLRRESVRISHLRADLNELSDNFEAFDREEQSVANS